MRSGRQTTPHDCVVGQHATPRPAPLTFATNHYKLKATYMSPRRRLFNFAIDDDLAAGLKAIKARTGVSESEQVRRAIQMWLESQGEMKKAERKRAVTRKRS